MSTVTYIPLEGFGGSSGSGGGGSELTIVGGTTRPTKATQNMIWVNTDVEITDYILAATEPEEHVEHMVWITISNSSSVKTCAPVGDDWITIYPISAKQYIGGEWASKDTRSYQDGEWVEWLPDGALYWKGNECVDITGGWDCKAWKMQSDAGTSAQTFEIARNADNLTFTKTGQIGAVMHTAQAIDLTNAKVIRFKGEMSKASKTNWVAFHVWSSISGTYWATNSKATVTTDTAAGKKEFSLDVSSLTGNFYLGFGIYDAKCSVKVEELVMEV